MTDVVVSITGIDSFTGFGILGASGEGVIAISSPDLAIGQGALIASGEGIAGAIGINLVADGGSIVATGDAAAIIESSSLVIGQGQLWFLLQSPIKIKGIAAAIEEGALAVGTNARATVYDPANYRRIQFSAGALTIARSAIAILSNTWAIPFGIRIRAGRVHASTAGNLAISGIGMAAAAGGVAAFSAAVITGVRAVIAAGQLSPFSKGILSAADSLIAAVSAGDRAVGCVSMSEGVIATVTSGNE